MVGVTSSGQANHGIDMTISLHYLFKSLTAAESQVFSWMAGPTSANALYIHGSDFTYSGSGSTTELASGTISSIVLDIGNDNGSATAGDLVIIGTETLTAANIRKGDARLFWNEILKGEDVFVFDGSLNAEQVGLADNVVFGDDYSSPGTQFNHADAGAADLMSGADNNFTLIGDVYEVKGGRISRDGPVEIASQYAGGDDDLTSAFTAHDVRLIGDGFNVLELGSVTGGNDRLDNSRTTGTLSYVAGDVWEVASSSSVTGGDDNIITGGNGAAAGDVRLMSGNNSFVQGGDDLLTGSFLAAAGDVGTIASGTSGNTVIGGDDRMIGSENSESLTGDILTRGTDANTIIGGNDVIFGRGGDDLIYGEVTFGSLAGVAGGNDRLSGGGGDDQLLGQAGEDILIGGSNADKLDGGTGNDQLRGGAGRDALLGRAGSDLLSGNEGNDRLTGGVGPDRFIFGLGSNSDRILDFKDGGGAGDDTIDVTAYNFASLAAIVKSASGDDLVLDLGNGNTIIVVDYLTTHAISDINGDIVI